MIGWLVVLMLAAFLSLLGSAMLMVACWMANRIVGPQSQHTLDAQLAEAAQVYRPVDAGPYTSPSTGHDGPTSSGPSSAAIPSPSFLHAFAIIAPTLVIGGLASCGLGGLFWYLSSGGNGELPWPIMLTFIVSIGMAFAAHALLVAWLLPTTLPRALLVAGLEAVPMSFVILALTGVVLLGVFSFRSATPPRMAPVSVQSAPLAPSAPPPSPAPVPGPTP